MNTEEVVNPSNFLCFNSTTIMIVIVLAIVIILYLLNDNNKQKYHRFKYLSYSHPFSKKNKIGNSLLLDNSDNVIDQRLKKRQQSINLNRIVNPLEPPEISYPHNRVGIPINIPTRGQTGPFQQVGTLTKIKEGNSNDPLILPLYGKPTYPGSSNWLYYTSTDSFNTVKISLLHKNKDCQKEYGCQEIYDGDTVTVPSYNDEFKVSIYELDKPRYIPYVF